MKTIEDKVQENEKNTPTWKKAGWTKLKDAQSGNINNNLYILKIPEGRIEVESCKKGVYVNFYKHGDQFDEEIEIIYTKQTSLGLGIGTERLYFTFAREKEADAIQVPETILKYAHLIRTLPGSIIQRLGDFENGHEIMEQRMKDEKEHQKINYREPKAIIN